MARCWSGAGTDTPRLRAQGNGIRPRDPKGDPLTQEGARERETGRYRVREG